MKGMPGMCEECCIVYMYYQWDIVSCKSSLLLTYMIARLVRLSTKKRVTVYAEVCLVIVLCLFVQMKWFEFLGSLIKEVSSWKFADTS